MKISSNKYLSLEEVAEFLGVEYQLVYRLVRSKQLPAVRVGRIYRISPVDLEQFIERGRTTNIETPEKFVCSACGTAYASQQSLTEKCVECGAPLCFDCATRVGRTLCRQHQPDGDGKSAGK